MLKTVTVKNVTMLNFQEFITVKFVKDASKEWIITAHGWEIALESTITNISTFSYFTPQYFLFELDCPHHSLFQSYR